MYTSFDSTQRLFGAGFNSLSRWREREKQPQALSMLPEML